MLLEPPFDAPCKRIKWPDVGAPAVEDHNQRLPHEYNSHMKVISLIPGSCYLLLDEIRFFFDVNSGRNAVGFAAYSSNTRLILGYNSMQLD